MQNVSKEIVGQYSLKIDKENSNAIKLFSLLYNNINMSKHTIQELITCKLLIL